MKRNSAGFTILELLVVISIIGLLSSVLLTSVSSARSKARDVRRIADMRQFMTALELYYESNGQYPASGGASSPNGDWSNSNDASWNTLQTAMAPYIARLPHDPKESSSSWPGAGGVYSYGFFSLYYGCSRQWYMLVYALETPKGPDIGMRACDNSFFQYGGGGADTAIKTIGMRAQ